MSRTGRTGGAGGARAARAFTEHYGRPPAAVWSAPGRVNVIGEHTDYNGGLALPIALPHTVVAAVGPGRAGRVRVRSLQQPAATAGTPGTPGTPAHGRTAGDCGSVDLPVAELAPGVHPGWAAYPLGVLWALRAAGHRIDSADILVDGTVPQGAGLSSSAALECAVAAALSAMTGARAGRTELARLAQRAENDFVGVPCGIMDQMAAMLCVHGHALLIDARDATHEQVPFDLESAGLLLLVIDTRAPHRLADGEYAARRAGCEHAARLLGAPCLREITEADLPRLDHPVLRRRARHVVTENARVRDTVALLRAGHPERIGDLLTASHASLRDDYEVTVPELDVAVERALAGGALGARMTGAGFGGSVIALIPRSAQNAVTAAVRTGYAERTWPEPHFLAATPSSGARPL